MTFQLVSGDCLDALAEMPEASVDAIVTDPPYGLEFMGKDWDKLGAGVEATAKSAGGFGKNSDTNENAFAAARVRYGSSPVEMEKWHRAWATEALRVLKPGGYLLAFGGTRTYHRLACGIEDAGFQVRDCLAWMYGSGFPKSLDVSKAIDKAAGAEREVVGMSKGVAVEDNKGYGGIARGAQGIKQVAANIPVTAPATPAAQKWQGWGTALKPAFEPIILARKPLIGTVAENVTRYGTGALNVDGCRVAVDPDDPVNSAVWTARVSDTGRLQHGFITDGDKRSAAPPPEGRWPANLILDEEAAAMLDEQSGESVSRQGEPRTGNNGNGWGMTATGAEYDDRGGSSRFFYQAKASRAERNAGLTATEADRPVFGDDGGTYQGPSNSKHPQSNVHPTVKPIDLMRWLVRLVTPPGGTVLDPFTGSGTTGIAAGLEGFDFIGIEREAEYREIAEARLNWWADKDGETAEILRRAGLAEKERERAEAVGQVSLFDEAA